MTKVGPDLTEPLVVEVVSDRSTHRWWRGRQASLLLALLVCVGFAVFLDSGSGALHGLEATSLEEEGFISRWDADRGFGFITPKDGSEDLFCHLRSVKGGAQSISAEKKGCQVTFRKQFNDRKGKYEATDLTVGDPVPRPLNEGEAEEEGEEGGEDEFRNFGEEDPWADHDALVAKFSRLATKGSGGSSTGGIDFNAYENIPVECTGQDVPAHVNMFEELKLPDALKKNIMRLKYDKPTPVQRYAIPIAIAGRDVMGCAQTGSGKTLAFVLPVLTKVIRLEEKPAEATEEGECQYPKAVVLAPTRELAIQIYEETRKFAYETGLRTVVIYGGAPTGKQTAELSQGCDILIATPGRLSDFIDRGAVSLESIAYFMIDEADRMLDMGFEPQIRKIATEQGMTEREKRQTMMFSATFPREMQALAADFLNNYVFITVGRVGSSTGLIEQQIEKMEENEKKPKLLELMEAGEEKRTLVFVETKQSADGLETLLRLNGYASVAIHGDKSQSARERALRSFRDGKTPVLIATDVAARGLDIPAVGHVINYDLPSHIDDYVHRIGRTGRAGHKGKATAFFTYNDAQLSPGLQQLLEESKQPVPGWMSTMARSAIFSGGSSTRGARNRFGGRDIRGNVSSSTAAQKAAAEDAPQEEEAEER